MDEQEKKVFVDKSEILFKLSRIQDDVASSAKMIREKSRYFDNIVSYIDDFITRVKAVEFCHLTNNIDVSLELHDLSGKLYALQKVFVEHRDPTEALDIASSVTSKVSKELEVLAYKISDELKNETANT